jgi:hypothetical protein
MGDDDETVSACAGGGVAELLGDFLPQPTIKIEAAITTLMVVFFIKCNAA